MASLHDILGVSDTEEDGYKREKRDLHNERLVANKRARISNVLQHLSLDVRNLGLTAGNEVIKTRRLTLPQFASDPRAPHRIAPRACADRTIRLVYPDVIDIATTGPPTTVIEFMERSPLFTLTKGMGCGFRQYTRYGPTTKDHDAVYLEDKQADPFVCPIGQKQTRIAFINDVYVSAVARHEEEYFVLDIESNTAHAATHLYLSGQQEPRRKAMTPEECDAFEEETLLPRAVAQLFLTRPEGVFESDMVEYLRPAFGARAESWRDGCDYVRGFRIGRERFVVPTKVPELEPVDLVDHCRWETSSIALSRRLLDIDRAREQHEAFERRAGALYEFVTECVRFGARGAEDAFVALRTEWEARCAEWKRVLFAAQQTPWYLSKGFVDAVRNRNWLFEVHGEDPLLLSYVPVDRSVVKRVFVGKICNTVADIRKPTVPELDAQLRKMRVADVEGMADLTRWDKVFIIQMLADAATVAQTTDAHRYVHFARVGDPRVERLKFRNAVEDVCGRQLAFIRNTLSYDLLERSDVESGSQREPVRQGEGRGKSLVQFLTERGVSRTSRDDEASLLREMHCMLRTERTADDAYKARCAAAAPRPPPAFATRRIVFDHAKGTVRVSFSW